MTPPEPTLTVCEIFASIQGESTRAGLPCIFIRLAGCSVGCSYCDTPYARTGGDAMTLDAILDRCAAWPWRLVEITGGEPLEQPECPALAAALLERGYTVLCETSGTRPIARLPEGVIKIMDVKCPGSGVAAKNYWDNLDALSDVDEVKFVMNCRLDYEFGRDIVRRYALVDRCAAVLFSPAFGCIEPRHLAEWILEDGLAVRLQLQLHKHIWPPDQRGV